MTKNKIQIFYSIFRIDNVFFDTKSRHSRIVCIFYIFFYILGIIGATSPQPPRIRRLLVRRTFLRRVRRLLVFPKRERKICLKLFIYTIDRIKNHKIFIMLIQN